MTETDRRDRTLAVAALGAVVAYHAALLFVQVRHPEPFLNDSVLHFGLVRALASAPARGQSLLDPWVPAWGLGFPVFHYYQSLPHLLVLAVWKGALGALRLVEAFKVVEWLAVVTLPVPVYLAGRKLGLGRAAAVAAGTLTLWIKTDYLHGLDLESYTWQGLGQYTQAVGGWFLPLGIAWTVTAVRDGRGYGLASLFMTITFLSHLALGYMGFMAVGLFTLLAPREIPRRVARLAIVAAVSVAASAWVVVPILRDFAYYNVSALVPSWKYNSFGAADVLGRLFRGELFDFGRSPVLTVLVGIGVGAAAVRARCSETARLGLVLFLFFLVLFFGRPTLRGIADLLPLGKGFHFSRAIYLVHQLGAILAGVATAELLRRLGRVPRFGWPAAVVIAALVAAPMAAERTRYLRHNADLVREGAAGLTAERADLEAALELARADRHGRTYAGLGRPGGPPWGGAFMVGWAPVYSWLPIRNMDALGYLHHMWSLNADLQGGFHEGRADHYRALNVRRVIAPEGGGAPPFAEPLAQFGRFRVFAVDGPGFVELVDAPYWVNVPKRNVSRLHRAWLAGRMPAAGIHPAVRLHEEGDPVADGWAADGVDVRLPDASLPPGPRGEVLSVERRGDDFTADARADRACHLVLKMTYHPGWRARVNGEPAATVQLMPSFVGVELPPGRHRVELRWEPGPQKGRLLAGGLLVLAALFVVERRFPILRAATPGR